MRPFQPTMAMALLLGLGRGGGSDPALDARPADAAADAGADAGQPERGLIGAGGMLMLTGATMLYFTPSATGLRADSSAGPMVGHRRTLADGRSSNDGMGPACAERLLGRRGMGRRGRGKRTVIDFRPWVWAPA